MLSVLDVKIFAGAVGEVGDSGLGHVGHLVEIATETDVLYLPVTANVLLNHTRVYKEIRSVEINT